MYHNESTTMENLMKKMLIMDVDLQEDDYVADDTFNDHLDHGDVEEGGYFSVHSGNVEQKVICLLVVTIHFRTLLN